MSSKDQISALKTQLEEEKKKHKSEVDKLEKIIQAKNDELEKFQIKNTWDMVEDNTSILRDQLEAIQKMNAAFQTDIQQKSIEINNFRKEVTDLQNENKGLKEQIEKLNSDIKNMNTQYETIKNQFELVKKQKEVLKQKEEKYKEDIDKKNLEIEELKKNVKKLEDNNNDLLKYVKDVQEKEEEKRQKEIQLRLEKEKELKEKVNDINKIKQENESKDLDQEEKDKFLTDILCEFLLKLNNSQYFISVFELLDNCLKHYDELKFFKKMDSLYGCPLNHTLYNFFGSFSSYISISSENISLSDFLSQKFFKYS
jgi:chromosome segregation ATPase